MTISQVGKTWGLRFGASPAAGVMLVGALVAPGQASLRFGPQRVMLDLASLSALAIPAKVNELSFAVPPNPSLVGTQIWAQRFDVAALQLSNPVGEIVRR